MTVALRLANFVSRTEFVPKTTQDAAVKAVFDLMSAVVAGYGTAGASAVRNISQTTWGSGSSAIWFSGRKSTAIGAAFANATCACALDLDDGHRAAAGHPGSAIIPAVLAAVDFASDRAGRALTAIAIGYEIGIRISAARDLRTIPTTDSALWSGQGVAAAVGWLRGLPPTQIGHAIAIAGTTSPSQSATPYTRFMGNSVKEGIPWAAANGLLAASLAEAGLTGPIDLLDDPNRFDQSVLVDGIGSDWQIEGIYFKPYSCCRWIHAPIDAVLDILDTHRLRPDQIDRIDVETFGRALTLNNEPAPITLEGAQYSIPFCLGIAVCDGPQALLPLEPSSLANHEAIALAQRVRMSVDPALDAMFPISVPARVRITTPFGIFEREVLAPRGEPSNPLSWDDIDAKFRAVAARRLGIAGVSAVIRGITALHCGDSAPIREALSLPLLSLSKQAADDVPMAIDRAEVYRSQGTGDDLESIVAVGG